MRQLSELKETAWWMLAIFGAAALVYDIAWYGEMIALQVAQCPQCTKSDKTR